jgi:hypothetical protein
VFEPTIHNRAQKLGFQQKVAETSRVDPDVALLGDVAARRLARIRGRVGSRIDRHGLIFVIEEFLFDVVLDFLLRRCHGACECVTEWRHSMLRASCPRVAHVRRALGRERGARMRDEGELRELWAQSYDGWVDVPGVVTTSVVYLKPTTASLNEISRTCEALPSIVNDAYLFAVTGFNPMGVEVDAATNAAANAKLLVDLRELRDARALWPSFGFSADWREDGYVCAFDDRERGLEAMVQVAIKYAQGAIYAYEPVHDGSDDSARARALIRRTVPAAMGDVVADEVIMVMCDEPKF